MEQLVCPVDVISVCTAEGEIRPLRLRLAGEGEMLQRVDIVEVIRVRQVPYVGVEAYVYTCRAKVGGCCRLLELKYGIRSHTWWVLGFLC